MESTLPRISACLVVYNEEKVIERCLSSIKNLADEIIIVHDGECSDKTLEIAKKYTDKIFIKNHVGIAEPHRAFTFSQASGDWLFQIDADEWLEEKDNDQIKNLIKEAAPDVDGFILQWELWNGKKSIHFKGLQKMCLFRKKNFSFEGIPQTIGRVKGRVEKVDIFLHHRPGYSNVHWAEFLRKSKKWIPVHAQYFFPELVAYECFNSAPTKWIEYTQRVRRHPVFYLIFYPIKNFLGQLKNGLWSSVLGWNLAFQQYIYYVSLFYKVAKVGRRHKA